MVVVMAVVEDGKGWRGGGEVVVVVVVVVGNDKNKKVDENTDLL